MEIWGKTGLITLTIVGFYWGLLEFSQLDSSPSQTAMSISMSIFNFSHQNVDRTQKYSRKNGNKSLLIFVHSARENFDRRQRIRESWGSYTGSSGWFISGLIFMVGQPSNSTQNSNVSGRLESEILKYGGDVVVLDMIDTYRNLTEKAVRAYKWIVQKYAGVSMVLKLDDDVFVNPFQLARSMNEIRSIEESNNFYCFIRNRTQPFRTNGSKWYVSKKEYPGEFYPPYCLGYAYLVPMTVVKEVTKEFGHFKEKIWIDDLFVTGIVPDRINSLGGNSTGNGMDGREKRRRRKIGFFDRAKEWFKCPTCNSDEYLKDFRRWHDGGHLNTTDHDGEMGFKENYIEKVFFLLPHDKEMMKGYQKLWKKVREIEG